MSSGHFVLFVFLSFFVFFLSFSSFYLLDFLPFSLIVFLSLWSNVWRVSSFKSHYLCQNYRAANKHKANTNLLVCQLHAGRLVLPCMQQTSTTTIISRNIYSFHEDRTIESIPRLGTLAPTLLSLWQLQIFTQLDQKYLPQVLVSFQCCSIKYSMFQT